MNRNGLRTAAFHTFVFIVALAAAYPMEAQDAKSPVMAPLGQYLMERNAEIALARSAAAGQRAHERSRGNRAL